MGSDAGIKILCVDDEPNVLRTLQRFFLRDDYQILTAASAAEGLAQLKEQGPVQVIISDFRMPETNGVDFLKKVHSLYPATVGILLSGFSDPSMVSSALDECLIYRQIAKPWNRQELRSTVDEALKVYAANQINNQLPAKSGGSGPIDAELDCLPKPFNNRGAK